MWCVAFYTSLAVVERRDIHNDKPDKPGPSPVDYTADCHSLYSFLEFGMVISRGDSTDAAPCFATVILRSNDTIIYPRDRTSNSSCNILA